MRGSEYADLRAFAAVAEAGSFSRAAARLGISPSALSQTIRGLEARLGVRLLNRTTRSVNTTEAGERLFMRLKPLFAELESAVEEVGEFRDAPNGRLRINAPRVAATHLIAPMLGIFHRSYPGIMLEVVVDDTFADIVAGRFDAGVRLGEQLEKDMVAVKLTGDLELMAIATPDYFARHGVPRTPADLHLHRCLNYRRPTRGDLYRWEFTEDGRDFGVAVDGPLIVNDSEVLVSAVLSGAGVGYLLDWQVRAFVENGTLMRVLEQWSPKFPGFYLYHPSHRHLPPALRAFIEVMQRMVRKKPSRATAE